MPATQKKPLPFPRKDPPPPPKPKKCFKLEVAKRSKKARKAKEAREAKEELEQKAAKAATAKGACPHCAGLGVKLDEVLDRLDRYEKFFTEPNFEALLNYSVDLARKLGVEEEQIKEFLSGLPTQLK